MDNAGGVMKGREAEGVEAQGGEKAKVYRKVKREAIAINQNMSVLRGTRRMAAWSQSLG